MSHLFGQQQQQQQICKNQNQIGEGKNKYRECF